MCDPSNLVLYHGERRRVALRVWMCNDTPLTIVSPTWALYKSGQQEASGSCDPIHEGDGKVWYLWCEIQPQYAGMYRLEYRYLIGTEIIIRKVNVEVIP